MSVKLSCHLMSKKRIILDIENSEISEWSVGFVDAMYASDDEEDDWFDDDDSEEDVAMLTLPMILF